MKLFATTMLGFGLAAAPVTAQPAGPMTIVRPAAGGYMQPGNPNRGVPNAAPMTAEAKPMTAAAKPMTAAAKSMAATAKSVSAKRCTGASARLKRCTSSKQRPGAGRD